MNRNAVAGIGYAVAIAGGVLAYLTWDGSPVLAGTAALVSLALAGAALGVSLSKGVQQAAGRGEDARG